jgi:hypothetical protein
LISSMMFASSGLSTFTSSASSLSFPNSLALFYLLFLPSAALLAKNFPTDSKTEPNFGFPFPPSEIVFLGDSVSVYDDFFFFSFCEPKPYKIYFTVYFTPSFLPLLYP